MHHMSKMPRQTVSFTDRQDSWLQDEAARLRITVSDLIRRIVDQHIEQKERQ